MRRRDRLALALAGAAGAFAWGLQQPLDKRMLRSRYDDIELLGRAVRPHGDGWRSAGWTIHGINGAAFGLAYSELLRRTPHVPARASAQAMVQAENFGLFPLAAVLDRVHPARDQLPRMFGTRQLLQATWRHAILGTVLGEVASRLRAPEPARPRSARAR